MGPPSPDLKFGTVFLLLSFTAVSTLKVSTRQGPGHAMVSVPQYLGGIVRQGPFQKGQLISSRPVIIRSAVLKVRPPGFP